MTQAKSSTTSSRELRGSDPDDSKPVTKPRKKTVRKNIDLPTNVKNRFEEIAEEESENQERRISMLYLLREALSRLLTHWWLHDHARGTLTIKFLDRPTSVLVDQFGIMSVPLKLLNLDNTGNNDDERERINLSLPQSLLDELELIADAQGKPLTALMRESFYLELLLYELKRRKGEAYITLSATGKVASVVSDLKIENPSPKYLLLLEGIGEDS